ncbi:MAG: peptide chain release factor 2 [Saprospiraceae bacterium]
MTTDQLADLKVRLASLRGYLDVPGRLITIEEKEQLSGDPNFWDDPERAQSILKVIKLNKKWVEQYNLVETAIGDAEVLLEFQKAGEATEEEVEAQYQKALDALEDIEFRSTLNEPEDEMNAILEINAGAGGTEACDWASMLLRMYVMWAEKNDFKTSTLHLVDGDTAGIKSVGLEITGDYAFGLLKGENGVHRLVRVSPFNSQGKRMTSFASVFVHPMIDDSIEVEVNPSDLRWDTFRASGAGGQHVNKTESAVRVTHIPTGIVAECQQERSQHQNREKAMILLKSRLYEVELEKQKAEKDKIESGKMKNEWGSQIRSYVLDDRWVKDLRTGYKVTNPDKVLDGDLDGFLKAYLMNNISVEE